MEPKANDAIDSLIDMEQYITEPISTGATGPDMGQLLSDEALENEWTKFFLTSEWGNNIKAVENLLDMWKLYGEKSHLRLNTDKHDSGKRASYTRKVGTAHHWRNEPDYMTLRQGDIDEFLSELSHGLQYARNPEKRYPPFGESIEDLILGDVAYGIYDTTNEKRYFPKLGINPFEGQSFESNKLPSSNNPLIRGYRQLLAPFIQWHEYQPGITDESILPFEFEAHYSIEPRLWEEFIAKTFGNLDSEESPETAKQYLETLMEE